jgi:CRISPR-associated protein Csd1
MIVKKLCDAAALFETPPTGYTEKPLTWFLDIAEAGTFGGFVKLDKGTKMPLPHRQRSGKSLRPGLFVDNAMYVLGKGLGKVSDEIAETRHAAFVALARECLADTRDADAEIAVRFFESGMPGLEMPEDILANDNVAIRVGGRLLHTNSAIMNYWASSLEPDEDAISGTCTVCGRKGPIYARMPLQLKRIAGNGETIESALISGNSKAFESYGQEEALGAGVCWTCGWSHALAVNAMTADKKHHISIGGVGTFIFWVEGGEQIDLFRLLDEPLAEEVSALISSPWKPTDPSLEEARFNCMFLVKNSGRVSVQGHHEIVIGDLGKRLADYFGSMAIGDGKPIPLYWLLKSLVSPTQKNAMKKQPKWIAKAFVEAALLGRPIPPTILQQAVLRTRTDEYGVTKERAAIIKMVLMSNGEKEITMGIDRENGNTGYLCGRLFATLEIAQYGALGKVNASITDRYFASAQQSPRRVFPLLVSLATKHLRKMRRDKPGFAVACDKEIQAIIGELKEYPASLTLKDQGMFSIGYYHQKTGMFDKE